MANNITKVYSIPNPKAFIYKKECRHWQAHGGEGERFYLYSANGLDKWHLNPAKAWADYEALPERYDCLAI